MLPIWTSEFLQAVSRMDPKFIALHLQEVGGKAYEKSMQYVEDFVQRLCDCPELRLYDKIRIFLDEDFSSPERFTVSRYLDIREIILEFQFLVGEKFLSRPFSVCMSKLFKFIRKRLHLQPCNLLPWRPTDGSKTRRCRRTNCRFLIRILLSFLHFVVVQFLCPKKSF